MGEQERTFREEVAPRGLVTSSRFWSPIPIAAKQAGGDRGHSEMSRPLGEVVRSLARVGEGEGGSGQDVYSGERYGHSWPWTSRRSQPVRSRKTKLHFGADREVVGFPSRHWSADLIR